MSLGAAPGVAFERVVQTHAEFERLGVDTTCATCDGQDAGASAPLPKLENNATDLGTLMRLLDAPDAAGDALTGGRGR